MSRRKIFELFGSIVIEGMGANKKALKELNKDIRATNKTLNKMGRDAMKVGKTITKGLTLPLLAVSAAVVRLTNDTAKYADQLLDLQQVTGVSTDNLQGLEAVAVEAGVKFEGLTDTIAKLTSKIPELESGTGRASEAINQLGVDVFDSAGNVRDMNSLFPEIVNELQDVENITERNALSQQIFGKSLKDIAPVLSLSKDRFNELFHGAEDLAGFMSSDAIESANQYRIQLEELKREFTGTARELSSTFIPIIQDVFLPIIIDHVIPAIESVADVIETLFEWFGKHPIISDFVGTFVAALAVMGPLLMLFTKFLPLIKSAFALYKALTAAQVTLNLVMAANPVGLIVLAIGALIAAGVALVKNWDKIKPKFVEVWDTIKFHFMNIIFTIIKNYSFMILKVLEGISKLGKFLPAVGMAVDFLVEKITAGTEAINAQQEALQAHRKEQLAAQKLAKEEAKAVEEATKAREAETKATSDNTDEKKKNKNATLEEIEAAKEAAQKREKFESEWTGKLSEQSENRADILEEERKNALAEAEKLGADKQAILDFYAKEEEKLNAETAKQNLKTSQKLASEQAALIDDDLTRLQTVTAQKLQQNELEKQEAVRIANERGVETSNIVALYRAREERIIKEAAVSEQKISTETKDKRISNVEKVFQVIGDIASRINSIWQTSLNNRTAELDAETEKRKEAVEASVMSEEEKADAIAEIDAQADEKKKVLQRENAIREKASTLFGIGLATALAITKALTIPVGGIALAAVVGSLGLIQLGVAAAAPLPMAEGALVKSDPGRGVLAQIGEGKQDEIVLPMKTGAVELAKNIIGKMKDIRSDLPERPAPRVQETHLHIGTLIADELGLKKLSKVLNKYTVAEQQRTGVANA